MKLHCKPIVLMKMLHYTGTRGARCSSVVRAFAYGAMDRRIGPSW